MNAESTEARLKAIDQVRWFGLRSLGGLVGVI